MESVRGPGVCFPRCKPRTRHATFRNGQPRLSLPSGRPRAVKTPFTKGKPLERRGTAEALYPGLRANPKPVANHVICVNNRAGCVSLRSSTRSFLPSVSASWRPPCFDPADGGASPSCPSTSAPHPPACRGGTRRSHPQRVAGTQAGRTSHLPQSPPGFARFWRSGRLVRQILASVIKSGRVLL